MDRIHCSFSPEACTTLMWKSLLCPYSPPSNYVEQNPGARVCSCGRRPTTKVSSAYLFWSFFSCNTTSSLQEIVLRDRALSQAYNFLEAVFLVSQLLCAKSLKVSLLSFLRVPCTQLLRTQLPTSWPIFLSIQYFFWASNFLFTPFSYLKHLIKPHLPPQGTGKMAPNSTLRRGG